MKIELHKKTIREVVNGYKDSQENGVVGYGGKLNIRPAFQREFVYKEKQRYLTGFVTKYCGKMGNKKSQDGDISSSECCQICCQI